MAGNSNSGSRPRRNYSIVVPDLPIRAPENLSAPALAAWEVLAPIARAIGTLTAADVPAFAVLCQLQATFSAAVSATPQKTEDLRKLSAELARYFSMFKMQPSSTGRGLRTQTGSADNKSASGRPRETVKDFAARARARLQRGTTSELSNSRNN